jgi:hypothetical protein
VTGKQETLCAGTPTGLMGYYIGLVAGSTAEIQELK